MSRIVPALLIPIAALSFSATVAKPDEADDLRRKLRDRDPIVRLHAAARLGELAAARRLHPINFRHERELVDALADSHTMVRFYSADALGNLDPRAVATSDSLAFSVICDPAWIVSRKAAFALRRVNPRLADVSVETMLEKRLPETLRVPLVPSARLSTGVDFEKLLRSSETPKWSAIIGEPTESLVQRVSDLRGHSRHPAALATPSEHAFFVRLLAVLELERRLPTAEFIPHLVPLLDGSDWNLRRIALPILLDLAAPGEELAIHILAHSPPGGGALARLEGARTAKTIAAVGPNHVVSGHLLRRFYDVPDLRIQLGLVEAIARLGLSDRATQEFLTRIGGHRDSEMRKLVAGVIRDAGLTEKIIREFLVPDLLSNEPSRWERAWTALGELDLEDGEILLIGSLRSHDSPRVRLAALAMLQRAGIAEDAEAIVAPAVEMLNSPDAWTRTKAAEVLGRAGPKARVAIPALGRALSDEDRTVSSTAMEALKAIGTERR